MKKSIITNKERIISILLKDIQLKKRGGANVDGHYLANTTQDNFKSRSLHMTSGEVSHFIRCSMINRNFNNFAVRLIKKHGNNGCNEYYLEDLDAETDETD